MTNIKSPMSLKSSTSDIQTLILFPNGLESTVDFCEGSILSMNNNKLKFDVKEFINYPFLSCLQYVITI